MIEMLWKFVSEQFERWTLRFRRKIWGFIMKKIKVRLRPPSPHVVGPLRKILKHQIKVDINPWWLVPVSIIYDNLYWNKYECFSFFFSHTVQYNYIETLINLSQFYLKYEIAM